MNHIAREFRKRDRHVQKMTRDGLVDKNLSTGEESRASQRGQDFNLQKREAQEPMRHKGGGPERQPPSLLGKLRDHRPPPPERPADYRQDAPPAEAPATSYEIQDAETAGFPMEAARPTERSHEARSHETPAGPPPNRKRGAFAAKQAAGAQNQPEAYPGTTAPVSAPYSAENPRFTHQNATENETDAPTEQPEPGEPPQRGRLRFEREPATGHSDTPPLGIHDRQRGTKYTRKFMPDAARPGGEESPASPPGARRDAGYPHDTRRNATADAPIPPERDLRQAGRLRFEGEPPPSRAEPRGAAPPKQRGAEYARRFAPDAPQPVPGDGQPPESPGKLRFTADERPPAPDKKLDALQKKADKAAAKLDKARDKLPTRTRVVSRRVFDEGKGRAKTKLSLEKEIKPLDEGKPKPAAVQIGMEAVRMSRQQLAGEIHQAISEVEKENVGTEAAHKLEQAAEDVFRAGRSVFRFAKEHKYKRVAKLEKRAAKAGSKLSFEKAVRENPKLKGKSLSRKARKKRMQKRYAKKARETAVKAAKKAGKAAANRAKALASLVKAHPAVVGVIAAALLIAAVFSSMLSSCTNMAFGALGAVASSSYLAEDAEINGAEAAYTEWETDLRLRIEDTETDFPDYDEYNYDIGEIGHDPLALLAYLTARFQEFTLSGVLDELRGIFDEQYRLDYDEETETRYDSEDEPYDWRILNVTLTVTPLADVLEPRMTGEDTELYDLMMDTHGNRQYTISPFAFDWEPYITSHYGWRPDPYTGEKSFHNGIDMGVPSGTEVVAGHDGVVSMTEYGAAGYGYQVKIDGEDALQTRYAHLSEILVSEGQEVKKGDVIARTGNTGNSTGPHLHYEVIVDGNTLNPLFFAETDVAV